MMIFQLFYLFYFIFKLYIIALVLPNIIIVIQLLSHVWLFGTPWTTAHQASLYFTISQSTFKLCPLSQWSHPTISSSVIPFSSCLHSFPESLSFPVSQLFVITWPKYWSFSFSISPSNDYSGLISFRKDWFDLALQGTIKGHLQHHSWKESILWCSAFLTVQLSHPYMTTGKTTEFTIWTFVSKVMSLLLNTLSRLVIVFLPRSLI